MIMSTLEGLRKKINVAEDLHSIVKTMKSLAMINIRHYEKAVASLADYNRTVEMGLQALFKWNPELLFTTPKRVDRNIGVIIFGSDQGLCGRFNENIVEYALVTLDSFGYQIEDLHIVSVGDRVHNLLKEVGGVVEKAYHVPASLTGTTDLLQKVLLDIETWNIHRGIGRVLLFYNHPLSAVTYHPQSTQLLPLDQEEMKKLAFRPWSGSGFPVYNLERDRLYSRLIRQFLFVNLYRAIAESAASENASRLATLQSSEKNIEESLERLNTQFHQQRQDAITDELLDIVAGFEVLAKNKKKKR
jgi:F-type H+-transporting ATPase subunit gamma